MSFAAQTKKELTNLKEDRCCLEAELSALIRIGGILQVVEKSLLIDIQSENAAIARHVYKLLKELYQIQPDIIVRRKMRLKKNNIYIVRTKFKAKEVLQKLQIIDENYVFYPGINPKILKSKCCKRAYLRGAFLAGGSVNNPGNSAYHLEITGNDRLTIVDLTKVANRFNLNAKWIERKKGYVMYIKESEKIAEFLSIVGAHQALLHFEDVRIVKDMRNSVNRLVNCETANLNKVISAALRQTENIQLIDREVGIDNLPEKLKELAKLRLKYPEANLAELGEMLTEKVSKSGVNHRMRKLEELAKKLKNK